ncbi:peptidase S46 [Porphyromonas gingivicanis]|uniref:Peptidase S46 n=1 Tax=Porphyromonas gingivicanis TaxID=266762 RepID=A0A0A2G4Z4_9PORP|nr:S46 family peptidase [Porphyromonas gingivicanis]KGN97537.1 peptidase S46 [Porphyromonas gingivicanis]
MNKRLFLTPILALLVSTALYADGGMWLMQQINGQMERMKSLGMQLEALDLYNPEGNSLKDAVVLFDGGCSGVLVSSQGLLLTNHHCGYDQIQKHSTVQHNYLQDGFWSHTLQEELPNPGLEAEIIDRVDDVTEAIKKELKKIKDPNSMDYLSPKYLSSLAPKIVGKKAASRYGYRYEIKAFYGGNRYYMFTKKVFSDVRLVAAPPSSIGKFGSDTDNWAWPRHTGDFSIFRLYVDRNGNPAPYSKDNVPYTPKKFIPVSAKGVQEGQFAFIMGFPGTTYRFFTADEVTEWSEIDNNIRIEMRGIRQDVMLHEMLSNEEINIMYAAKYASSQNGYKRAQGANWAIRQRGLYNTKLQQQQEVIRWAEGRANPITQDAVKAISKSIAQRKDLRTRQRYLLEGILVGIEFSQAPIPSDELINSWDNTSIRQKGLDNLRKQFTSFYNADYSPRVDQAIATALLKRYTQRIAPEKQPEAIRLGVAQAGSVETYVKNIFEHSIYASKEKFETFMKQPNKEQLLTDPMTLFALSVHTEYTSLMSKMATFDAPLAKAQRDYIGSWLAMVGEEKLPADANLTLRFTYGQIKGYIPRNAVAYEAKTTLDGVMEKEDPNNWEYVVAPRLKELYDRKDFGRYANTDGTMPVNFCATTHTTGGNSGSPVFNAQGELIGLNFDRNWEGVGGDIEYLPNYQRSIILDIRYLLFVIDKFAGCQRLIDEINPKF